MKRLLPAIAIFALIPLSLAAADQATGTFTGSQFKFAVKGAYAYWSHSDDEGPLIEIAVSNDGFIPSAFDGFYDPKPVIDTQFVDDKTAVIYFQFKPNGQYHGMHYYLGSGDGCGFCSDSSVKSTMKFDGGRAKGALKYSGDKRSWDITIDVPLGPKEWGAPIKGDGGDIGAAFKAYNAAMESGNRKAIFDILDANTQAYWKKQEKAGKLDGYLDYRQEKIHYRLKHAQIVKGFTRENQAVLLVKGSNPLIDHIHGQVVLAKEGGKWKIADEVYEVGE